MKTVFRILDARETFLESVGTDIVTFGFLLICIWASYGNFVWSIIVACMFLIFATGRIKVTMGKDMNTFHNKKDLQAWVDTLKE